MKKIGLLCTMLLGSMFLEPFAVTLPAVQAAAVQDTARYAGFIWRVDSANKAALPRNFRCASDAFGKADKKFALDETYVPSRKGLDTLQASGSAEFSAAEFHVMAATLKKQAKGPVYIVDLRQESHGLFNGSAVSWYGKRDWGNLGKTRTAVLQDEQHRVLQALGQDVTVAVLGKDKAPAQTRTERVTQAMTEQTMVEAAGLGYVRITATDHVWTSPACVDDFIAFYRQLPKDAWLHFHCQAGVGRTTTYLAMYDMMRNPELPLKDILYRQHLLGGTYLGYTVDLSKQKGWKGAYYNEKARMIQVFYAYVQANHANNFPKSWSAWLAETQQGQ